MNRTMPQVSTRSFLAPGVGLTGALAIGLAAGWRIGAVGLDAVGVSGAGAGLAVGAWTLWLQWRFQRLREHKCATEVARWRDETARLARDVEARTRSLTEVNAHLRAWFDGSALGLLVFDPNDADVPMRIIDCNEMTCQMHGYSREELIGRSLRLIDQSYVQPANTREFLDGIRARGRVHGEATHVRKDGSTFPIEFATCVLSIGGRELVFGMDRDITERKRAEAALRSSEERWQLAVTGSRDGIWDRNLVTGEGYLSPQWKRMLGYSPDDLGTEQNVWLSLIHPDDQESTQVAFQAHLEGRAPVFQHEYRLRRKDGSWLWVLSRGMAQFDAEGRATRIVGVNTDISEQKEFEAALRRARDEAEAANRSKSAFLAVMSHEIRTPMNGVIGFTNLLLDTELNPQQLDWLTTIRHSGESLLALINDILDFSKIESGRLDLEIHPVYVRGAIEEVMDLLWSRAREKNLELLYFIEPGTPEWVATDAIRLRQILVNLIGNAIKFTERGEVEVDVRAEPDAGGRPQLLFDVRDTGIGIPLDRVSRLFKPFSQADTSTTRRYGGTGLGLAICRSLARLLGGDIEISSTGPQGSVFRFHVTAPPAKVSPEERARLALGAGAASLASLAGKRVLAVDDNEANRRILAATLAQWGVECDAHASGAAALTWLEHGGRADGAVVDLMMPGMNGIQFATLAQAQLGDHPLPMILLSSAGAEELRSPGARNFRRILAKPLHQESLFEALQEIFGEASMARGSESRVVGPAGLDRGLATRHPLRILVAEDNPVNQKLIAHLLTRLGYRPDTAGNGLECLDALRVRPYDLVLMDCQMPEMDGYEATERIRSGNAGAHHRTVKIVALTAAAMLGDRERSLQAGMDDHLTKPVQPAALITILQSAIPQAQPRM